MQREPEPAGPAAADQPRQPGFTFVLNVRRVVGAEQYELAPGHYLRIATDDEVGFIKFYLKRIEALLPVALDHWEVRLGDNPGHELLPPAEWRYYVIGCPEILDARVQRALDLADPELEFGFEVIFSPNLEPAVFYHPRRLFNALEGVRAVEGSFLEIQSNQAAKITDVIAQVVNTAPHTQDCKRLIEQFDSIKHLPRESPLVFLGYFGILEALLTHAPKSTDPYDTITRQVKNKIALLNNNHWPYRLDYSPFGGASPDTVWTRMYNYRSLLAHGEPAALTGTLAVLGNPDRALSLLKSAVKSSLLFALGKPDLMADLKNC